MTKKQKLARKGVKKGAQLRCSTFLKKLGSLKVELFVKTVQGFYVKIDRAWFNDNAKTFKNIVMLDYVFESDGIIHFTMFDR